jgi:hypothetical protein
VAEIAPKSTNDSRIDGMVFTDRDYKGTTNQNSGTRSSWFGQLSF